MTEQAMLSKDAFIDFILSGPDKSTATTPEAAAEAALPEGFEGFDSFEDVNVAEASPPSAPPGSSFARRLLEASGFGYAEMVQRDSVIRSTDAVARDLPERVSFWPKTASRSYQTLLFEADLTHRQLLAIPAFKTRKMAHLDIVEDALARLVSEALEGFQRGGEGVTADVRKGRKEETLCVVSILDERDGETVRLVCFGTQNRATNGLETFQITEQTRFWDPQLAREHLGLLYERQFRKLEGHDWQEAFTTTEERRLAEKLLDVCTRVTPAEHDIQEGVLDLLDIIAKGFGLRKPPNRRRLQAFALPSDHDIGIDPEVRETSFAGKNPFGGVTLRDERSRLLGYIVYPLKNKADAVRLGNHLAKNNRFHNVLVVYPDEEQASLELWQGHEQLTGKLRKGQGYKDAADIVNLLSRFFVVSKAKVKNPTELAQELAYRARYLRRLAVKQLAEEKNEGPLRNLYNAFKEGLVHDMSEDKFADAYAQTITYGLLTARWTGNAQLVAEGERLTRQTALKHMPASSPFLKAFFKSVLAVRSDEQRGRLLWLVDDIADLLDRVDVEYVFGAGDPESTITKDPVIHFYEPFLNAYDPKLKKELGVFYTPLPVVSYIVRSVHELLQTEFGLADGLADTTTWSEMLKKQPGLKLPPFTDDANEVRTILPDEPFVQILDPATGTATFLVEVIDVIHRTLAAKWKQQLLTDAQQRAAWNDYVPQHLLPRLHAFELMMAPYAIAHMKIGLKLAETGYRFGTEERARIYLTNALEPSVKQIQLIGFDALAHEAAAVNQIKRHKRFTVVIGNPPYSNFGQLNRTAFLLGLLDDYKRGLNEKKLNLDDDFIKFVRFGQHVVQQSGVGALGLITNNVFLDGLTHRQMRRSLRESFATIRILDLHGSARKLETGREGGEENVFEIQQGVAVEIFSCPAGDAKPALLHADMWGTRDSKYRELDKTSIGSTAWTPIESPPPNFFFVPKTFETGDDFQSYPGLKEMFITSGNAIKTERDRVSIHFTPEDAKAAVEDFRSKDEAFLRREYDLETDSRDWKVANAKADVRGNRSGKLFRPILYRPFDIRHTWYSGQTRGFIGTPAHPTMKHLIGGSNMAMACLRQTRRAETGTYLVGRGLIGKDIVSIFDIGTVFPLFLYEETLSFDLGSNEIGTAQATNCRPNFSVNFVKALAVALQIPQEHPHGLPAGLTPEDIFHYAYAVFHSPGYRSRYAEFLKIDFPRLPLTGNLELFRALARLGGELTSLHLMESPKLAQPITEFIGSRHPAVAIVSWSRNTVWLDKAQTTGFQGVREDVWNFRIGGYQVCHKWLKDRKGRTLSDDDLAHYQKIVVALSETIRLMEEIDEVIDEHGGWPNAFATNQAGVKK